jgi:conjugal transfer/entry exclusion protein
MADSDPPRRAGQPPMRARMGSSDSFRAVTPDERELILRELKRLEANVLGELGEHREKLSRHEDAIRDLREAVIESRVEAMESKALRKAVEQLLGQDVSHDARLALLEAQRAGAHAQATAELGAAEAKDSARATSRRWSAVGGVLGTVIAAAIAAGVGQCSAPPEKPQPTHNPRRSQ